MIFKSKNLENKQMLIRLPCNFCWESGSVLSATPESLSGDRVNCEVGSIYTSLIQFTILIKWPTYIVKRPVIDW